MYVCHIQSLWFITLKLLISGSRIQLFIFVFILCVITRQREIYVGLVYEIKISRNQRVPHYHPRLGGSSSLAILIKVTIKLHRYRVWLASFNLPPNSRNGNAVPPISKTRLSPPPPPPPPYRSLPACVAGVVHPLTALVRPSVSHSTRQFNQCTQITAVAEPWVTNANAITTCDLVRTLSTEREGGRAVRWWWRNWMAKLRAAFENGKCQWCVASGNRRRISAARSATLWLDPEAAPASPSVPGTGQPGWVPCYTRVYNGSAAHAIHIPNRVSVPPSLIPPPLIPIVCVYTHTCSSFVYALYICVYIYFFSYIYS